MSKLVNLMTYIKESIDDIEKAIKERMIDTRKVQLSEYGNLIRSIETPSQPVSILTVVPVKKSTKIINADIHDYTPVFCHIEGYEALDESALIQTLELTDEDYE